MEKSDYYQYLALTFFFSMIMIFIIYTYSQEKKQSQSLPEDYFDYSFYSLSPGYVESGPNEGFLPSNLWKQFVNMFMISMFDYKLIKNEDEYSLTIDDDFGKERMKNFKISYDKNSGKASFSLDFILLDGTKKNIDYKIYIDSKDNINHYFNPDDFINKTLVDLLIKLLNDNRTIKLVGERSNLTIQQGTAFSESYPDISLAYDKANLSIDPINNTTIEQDNITISNNSEKKDEKPDSNLQLVKTKELKLINPKPSEYKIILKEGQEKEFSIENDDVDISWYLDNVKISDIGIVKLSDLDAGDHILKVEIKSNDQVKSTTWKITSLTTSSQPNKKNYIIFIIIIVLVLLISIIIYLLFKRKEKITLD